MHHKDKEPIAPAKTPAKSNHEQQPLEEHAPIAHDRVPEPAAAPASNEGAKQEVPAQPTVRMTAEQWLREERQKRREQRLAEKGY